MEVKAEDMLTSSLRLFAWIHRGLGSIALKDVVC